MHSLTKSYNRKFYYQMFRVWLKLRKQLFQLWLISKLLKLCYRISDDITKRVFKAMAQRYYNPHE